MLDESLDRLKGIAAILEYMGSADKVDVKYTKEALFTLAEELYEIIEENDNENYAVIQNSICDSY